MADESPDPVIATVDALPPLRAVIADHGLSARKTLGQNFLLDLNLTRKIARAASPSQGGTTIEIGPGPGGLTRALLLEGATNVIAIERDARCIAALQPLVEASAGRLTLLEADAMGMDISALGPSPRRIVANLPYNIATPLLVAWLKNADHLDSMTCMFQREVADRITAQPGEKAYSRLSVLSNWRCDTAFLFGLPAKAFTPPPKVASAVVQLVPKRPAPQTCDISNLETVTAAAFGQRRKMLRQSLKQLTAQLPQHDALDEVLRSLDIEPTQRAEQLPIEAFARLAAELHSD